LRNIGFRSGRSSSTSRMDKLGRVDYEAQRLLVFA
jgi:hypothetical protein